MRATLKTQSDAEAYVREVRTKIRRSFGPECEKTLLCTRVTGVVDRDAYRIERVIFESRPEFLVTANVYIPKGRTFPLPGVVGSCGHSVNGKAAEAYQSFAQSLARMGYVTLTTWLCGLERRWTMAAPGCFVTTFRRNLENELPADSEQCPPGVLALGLDHSDFLAAMAPKPVIILAKERDFFDVRGSIEAYTRLKRLYTLLGRPDDIELHIGPTDHGYSRENREAMYRWFNRVTRVSDMQSEPALTVESDETLWCTPHGQVAELTPKTVFSFTRQKSLTLAAGRVALTGDELRRAVSEAIKLPVETDHPAGPPDFRILRALKPRGYPRPHATSYAVETEAGIFALVTWLDDQAHHSRPPRGPNRAVLYISHQSADAELRDEPLLREVFAAEQGAACYACDVRGIGESRPDTCGEDSFLSPYGSDYFYAAHSIMLSRPYLGQRAYDVLRVLDWLAAFDHREVHLVAKNWGTLPALFAALLCERVVQVTLREAPASYAAIAESEEYDWPLSALLPVVLTKFDLPDCYQELTKTKRLRQVDPRGA